MEDDRRVSSVMVSMLQRRGYEVEHAATATAALEAAPCDLVLLDMNLPDMHGLDTVRALNEQISRQGLCVVLLTADSFSIEVIKAMSLGAREYWPKPLTPERLRDGLPRLLNPHRRGARNATPTR